MIVTFDYIIDSSAWIEYFGATPKALKIKDIIENKKIATAIIAVSEIVNKFDKENKQTFQFIEFIKQHATILSITIEIAINAGILKNEYRKKHPKFSLVDGIHLATAQQENSILLTMDTDFKDAKNAEVIF